MKEIWITNLNALWCLKPVWSHMIWYNHFIQIYTLINQYNIAEDHADYIMVWIYLLIVIHMMTAIFHIFWVIWHSLFICKHLFLHNSHSSGLSMIKECADSMHISVHEKQLWLCCGIFLRHTHGQCTPFKRAIEYNLDWGARWTQPAKGLKIQSSLPHPLITLL